MLNKIDETTTEIACDTCQRACLVKTIQPICVDLRVPGVVEVRRHNIEFTVVVRPWRVVPTRYRDKGVLKIEGREAPMREYAGVCSDECAEKLGPEWINGPLPFSPMPTLDAAQMRVVACEYVFATYANEYRIAVFRHGEFHYWIERYNAVLALMHKVDDLESKK